jgi:hypothetical protein
MSLICILDGGHHKPGDPPPIGYSQKDEWAHVQLRAGLRQVRCGRCVLYKFPQELSGLIDVGELFDSKGGIHRRASPVCLACAARTK